MESMDATHTLSAAERAAAAMLAADLRRVFGSRLRSLVAYGLAGASRDDLHTLALVERVSFEDLAACAPLARTWHRAGLAVPLLLGHDEFRRTVDVFPIEYGDIIRHHVVLDGDSPFAGIRVDEADVRRACEFQAKSHLIHLREGYLETGGDPKAVARLIAASAPSFRALLSNIAALDGDRREIPDLGGDRLATVAEKRMGVPASLVREILNASTTLTTIVDPGALVSRYITASERLWQYVDAWREAR